MVYHLLFIDIVRVIHKSLFIISLLVPDSNVSSGGQLPPVQNYDFFTIFSSSLASWKF